MFRNSFLLAATAAAGQTGPTAAMVCEMMSTDAAGSGQPLSEREIFASRAAAAARAQRQASRKSWRMPRVNWRGALPTISFRRPRLAA